MDGQDDRFAAPGGTPPSDGGFFAGSAPAAGSGFGYVAPAAPTSGSTYGPPPTAQFGAPAPVFGAPYTPTSAPPTPDAKTGPKKVVSGIVVALVVIGAGTYGWNVWKQHQPIHVPTSLGGAPALHTPAVDALVQQGQQDLETKEPGKHATAAAFGDASTGEIMILVGLRGRLISIQKDFQSGGATSPLQTVGKNTCATIPSGIMCERTSAHLTEGVISVSKTRTMQSVSALLDEAWSKA